ncbi:MAG: winged helix-turn-helix domain-containing protein [Bacteroidaceae bacterium]|nr:winged helix-turn-helix domain-containing protein [Bacteroidaceae bacterium]
MFQEKVGELAGAVWAALDAQGTLTVKDLKKAAKAKTEKDVLLALGWLLREDKVALAEEGKDIAVTLK